MNFGIETAAPEQRRPKPGDENSLASGECTATTCSQCAGRRTAAGPGRQSARSPIWTFPPLPWCSTTDNPSSKDEGIPESAGCRRRAPASRLLPAGRAGAEQECGTAAAPCTTKPSLKGLLARDDSAATPAPEGRGAGHGRSAIGARAARRNDTRAISDDKGASCIIRPTASKPLP